MPKVKVARCGIPRLAELVGEHHPVLLLRTSVPPPVLGAVLSRLWVGSKQRETSTGSLWLGRRQRPLQLHGGQPPARQWLHPALLVDVNNGRIQTSHPGGHFTPIHLHSPFLSLSHSLTSYRLPFHALGGGRKISITRRLWHGSVKKSPQGVLPLTTLSLSSFPFAPSYYFVNLFTHT